MKITTLWSLSQHASLLIRVSAAWSTSVCTFCLAFPPITDPFSSFLSTFCGLHTTFAELALSKVRYPGALVTQDMQMSVSCAEQQARTMLKILMAHSALDTLWAYVQQQFVRSC